MATPELEQAPVGDQILAVDAKLSALREQLAVAGDFEQDRIRRSLDSWLDTRLEIRRREGVKV